MKEEGRYRGRGSGEEGEQISPSPASQAPPGSIGWHEALEAHCERFLGRWPTAFGQIVQPAFPVTLYPHLPSPQRPWLTLRTGGVSDRAMSVPEGMWERRYCELLTYLPANWNVEAVGATMDDEEWWPAALLRQVGEFVHEASTWLDEEHTVVVSEPGETYASGTLTAAVLLLAPRVEPAEFNELVIDGTACRFLCMIPITEAETNLKVEQGGPALVGLIEEHGLSHVVNPARPCLVTGRRP